MTYRNYIADSIFYQAKNQRLTARMADLLHLQPEDNRTGEEIAADILAKAGIEVIHDESV